MVHAFTHDIDWPNGEGYTPCTKAAYDVSVAIDMMSDGGRISMDAMSREDYEKYNRLLMDRDNLQAEGHFGKGERF